MCNYFKIFLVFQLLFFIVFSSEYLCQQFSIELSPDTIIINGNQQFEFNIKTTASDGFNASIFLSLDLDYSYRNFTHSITINPVNYPYTTVSKLKINLK